MHVCAIQVQRKAGQTQDEYKKKLAAESEAFENSDLGKLLKKRTEENAEKNEAAIREQYCVKNCKFSKPLDREPRTAREFYCEECQLEFGVIPGNLWYW